ncbi:MAG: hypothetical protein H6672_16665 [Anaerolineaceae bacterium]|nr:hypothetical protein [Anaerolineaceae bacterium]
MRRRSFLIVGALLLVTAAALAQSDGDNPLRWFGGDGGGTPATGDGMTLYSSSDQPFTTTSRGGGYTLQSSQVVQPLGGNTSGNSLIGAEDDALETIMSAEQPIDIKPDTPYNRININSRGVIPVAIFGTPTVDVTTVNLSTLTLAGAPVAQSHRFWRF